MNKIKSIYPTQVSQNEQLGQLKETFDKFRNRLDLKIKDTIVFKKNIIIKQSSQYVQRLAKLKQNSQKYIKKLQQQQKQFQEKIQNHIKIDISKWDQYQIFFKDIFQKLQDKLQKHKDQNSIYMQDIRKKKIQLKTLLHQKRKTHSHVSSLIKLSQQKSTRKTTNQSSVVTDRNSQKHRVKTQSSLPLLKKNHHYNHIKSIETQSGDEQDIFMSGRQKKLMSYMQPTGVIKKQEQSSFPFLIQLLFWYKSKEQSNIGDHWFLKIIFNKRHFEKLLSYLLKNSSKRRVKTRKD